MVRATLHVNFFGRVQGVGMRMLVLSTANERKITGWVKNSHTVNLVEAVFQGERSEVEKIINDLKQGSGLIRIDRVEIEPVFPAENFTRFEVHY